jgi:hypothetical protein
VKRVTLQWKDITSWSKSDDAEARKTPRTWVLQLGRLELIVTRHILLPADKWLLRCHALRIEITSAPNASHQMAKATIIQRVKAELHTINEDMKYLPTP